MPAAAGLGPAHATYFADLATPHAKRHVRVCTATACFATQGGRHLAQIERELGVPADGTDHKGETSLQTAAAWATLLRRTRSTRRHPAPHRNRPRRPTRGTQHHPGHPTSPSPTPPATPCCSPGSWRAYPPGT
ncbi:NAD(P)H-dependent oxidoreductase subunit E, partial [Kitasatospora cinereorecta]